MSAKTRVISSAWNISALLFTACNVDIKLIFFFTELVAMHYGIDSFMKDMCSAALEYGPNLIK